VGGLPGGLDGEARSPLAIRELDGCSLLMCKPTRRTGGITARLNVDSEIANDQFAITAAPWAGVHAWVIGALCISRNGSSGTPRGARCRTLRDDAFFQEISTHARGRACRSPVLA
jgi:hypothetical protein